MRSGFTICYTKWTPNGIDGPNLPGMQRGVSQLTWVVRKLFASCCVSHAAVDSRQNNLQIQGHLLNDIYDEKAELHALPEWQNRSCRKQTSKAPRLFAKVWKLQLERVCFGQHLIVSNYAKVVAPCHQQGQANILSPFSTFSFQTTLKTFQCLVWTPGTRCIHSCATTCAKGWDDFVSSEQILSEKDGVPPKRSTRSIASCFLRLYAIELRRGKTCSKYRCLARATTHQSFVVLQRTAPGRKMRLVPQQFGWQTPHTGVCAKRGLCTTRIANNHAVLWSVEILIFRQDDRRLVMKHDMRLWEGLYKQEGGAPTVTPTYSQKETF